MSLGPLPVVNLVLLGVFWCLYAQREGSLVGVCVAHASYNWAESNLFGFDYYGDEPVGGSVGGGALSTDPLAGRIRHSGGLKFAAGGKSLTVKNFVINLNRGVLSARVVDGPRVPLLKLSGGDANVFGGRIVTLGGVEARLTPTAATALNDTLGTDAFAGNLLVGEASSIVVLAQ